MRRHLLAAAVLAPVATLGSVLPATAAPVPARAHVNTVIYNYSGNPAPLHALRSSTQKCAGTLVASKPAMLAGKTVAELDVYATPRNGGTIIACMKHEGATRGMRLATSADVVGSPTITSKKSVLVLAAGNYTTYAGPAAIGGVKGKCFAAGGAIRIGKSTITVQTKPACTK